MSKLLVTGATGGLGGLTVRALLNKIGADQIAALVRDATKAAHLSALGVDVRTGDYLDVDALTAAFQGIEKILLVSAVAFTDRLAQHLNVISAAKAAGVKHIVYTSIQRKPGSDYEIATVTASDLATERALERSGLTYTIVRNSLYLDALGFLLGDDVLDRGVRVIGGDGTAPMVARSDLAEANAVILTQPGHENKTYTLGASEGFSFRDVATQLAEITGNPVKYSALSIDEVVANFVDRGLPEIVAQFATQWIYVVATGEFEEVTDDLERLIGRKPISCGDFLRAVYRRPSL